MGEVFGEIYGHHYSKQSISRMASATKDELLGWLERPLDAYYPIVDVDCTFVPVRRDGSVSKEAFYTSPLDPERCHQSMEIAVCIMVQQLPHLRTYGTRCWFCGCAVRCQMPDRSWPFLPVQPFSDTPAYNAPIYQLKQASAFNWI